MCSLDGKSRLNRIFNPVFDGVNKVVLAHCTATAKILIETVLRRERERERERE